MNIMCLVCYKGFVGINCDFICLYFFYGYDCEFICRCKKVL